MASQSYSTDLYLLDRANIEDTLANMYHFADQGRYDELASKVLAAEMVVDYTSMFGGEPMTITGKAQAEQWKGMLGHMQGTQHVILGIVPELPQPGAKDAPGRVKVQANAIASLKRDDKLLQNGGSGEYEMVRTDDTSGNPWRIAYMKANIVWYSGDHSVLSDLGP